MDILRLRYEALCAMEAHIRREVCRAQEQQRRAPKLWVFQWLSEVARVSRQGPKLTMHDWEIPPPAAAAICSTLMDILRLKYEALCAMEAHIRREVCRAQEQQRRAPKLWVFQWLSEVARVKIQVLNIERSFQVMRTGCFFNLILIRKRSRVVARVSKQVDKLERAMAAYASSVAELLGTLRFFVDQCPDRSQLLDTIWKNLMDPDVGIINIYGNKAVGKTTAIRKIKNKLLAECVDIYDKVILVTVSSNWSLGKVQRDIALQMEMDVELSTYQDWHRGWASVCKSLAEMSFVIIFDDLWERIPLSNLGIPQPTKENGCKIVLISRELEICHGSALECCNHLKLLEKFIKVEDLSGEEAWDLFVAKAGDTVLTPEIQPFARQVVKVCPGLPILVSAVAHAMRDEVRIEVWSEIVKNYTTKRYATQYISNVLNIVRLCYARLKNDRLRNCFLYCALFPTDYLFTPEELIRYWMAQRFIQVLEDGDIAAETDEGFKILGELEDANMLERHAKGDERCLKMHDFFRRFALRIMNKKEEPNFRALMTADQSESIDFISNLSTWLLHDNNRTSHISPSVFSGTLNLKFLYISYSCITELPESISELAQLRALFLDSCTSLREIPTLEKMTKLQYLSLNGTSVTELPEGMERLVGLRFLDLSETTKLDNIRAGVISSLSCLEELRMRKSGLCKMESSKVAIFLKEVSCLKRLAILTLSTVGCNDLYDTIMRLQEQSLKIFSVNVYGSMEDYIEDVEKMKSSAIHNHSAILRDAEVA